MSLITDVITSKTATDMVLGAVRTGLAGAIPALVSTGWLPANQENALLGSLCFLAALGLSVFDKIVRGKEIKTALYTPVPTVSPSPQP